MLNTSLIRGAAISKRIVAHTVPNQKAQPHYIEEVADTPQYGISPAEYRGGVFVLKNVQKVCLDRASKLY